MAQATVTVKITPRELDTIVNALEMFRHACMRVANGNIESPLEGFKLDLTAHDADPRRAALVASGILTEIRR